MFLTRYCYPRHYIFILILSPPHCKYLKLDPLVKDYVPFLYIVIDCIENLKVNFIVVILKIGVFKIMYVLLNSPCSYDCVNN